MQRPSAQKKDQVGADVTERPAPEILAPVGDRAMAEAAVAGGADAIYLGFPGFNARGRSPLLSTTEIREILNFCRRAGVKVYIAFNVLIFEREWDALLPLIQEIIKLAPDAFLIQDVGLALLLKRICPGIRLHASTQMTITDINAMRFYDECGFSRYILARELSLAEIRTITAEAHSMGREVECFARGALCISYSGQCLTSESFGGGSANRGRCAQSCRFLYDVIVDGKVFARDQFAVSARDLNAGELTEALVEAGVDCLKIEGRLKKPAYVFSSIRNLRALIHAKETDTGDLSFSRRAFHGWLRGIDHQGIVDPEVQGHVGGALGTVQRLIPRENAVIVKPSDSRSSISIKGDPYPITPGDGIVFLGPRGQRTGASIYSTGIEDGFLKLTFGRDFDPGSIPANGRVFRNHSVAFEKELAQSMSTAAREGRVSLQIRATAAPGARLQVEYRDPDGNVGAAESNSLCEVPKARPVEVQMLEAELSSLGGTPYRKSDFSLQSAKPFFLHQREWKECRRRAIAELDRLRTGRNLSFLPPREALQSLREELADRAGNKAETPSGGRPQLHILLRRPEQLEGLPPSSMQNSLVYLDFEYGRHYPDAIIRLTDLGYRVGLCTLRVPADGGDLRLIERHRPHAVLVRNAAALLELKAYPGERIGDSSLNISNSLSANWFLARGLHSFSPAQDLNARELFDLLAAIDPSRGEMILHQRIPSFYMQYCLYARYLSTGRDHHSCRVPCLNHTLSLRDPEGETHPVFTDSACRNTMVRGRPQSLAAFVPELIRRGVQRFRIELLDEDPNTVQSIVLEYRSLMERPSREAARELLRRSGWSEGQLRKKDAARNSADDRANREFT